MIVAMLIPFGQLAGFHSTTSNTATTISTPGSTAFQLFLIFNELVDAERRGVEGFRPAYMLDQSHNVTDPAESLMASAVELLRAYVQAHLVDRDALQDAQEKCDALMALGALKQAFNTGRWRRDLAGCRPRTRALGWGHHPVATFSRQRLSPAQGGGADRRPARAGVTAGIARASFPRRSRWHSAPLRIANAPPSCRWISRGQ